MVVFVAFLALDVGVGVALLALIAALAARTAPRRGDMLRALGWLLVAVPLPAAVALHLAGMLEQTADPSVFLGGVIAFAAGAALLLGAEDDEEDWRLGDDDSPPWWPDFERELREYERDRLIRV
jgi:hypothetical protein